MFQHLGILQLGFPEMGMTMAESSVIFFILRPKQCHVITASLEQLLALAGEELNYILVKKRNSTINE
jgi:hypothetical protein